MRISLISLALPQGRNSPLEARHDWVRSSSPSSAGQQLARNSCGGVCRSFRCDCLRPLAHFLHRRKQRAWSEFEPHRSFCNPSGREHTLIRQPAIHGDGQQYIEHRGELVGVSGFHQRQRRLHGTHSNSEHQGHDNGHQHGRLKPVRHRVSHYHAFFRTASAHHRNLVFVGRHLRNRILDFVKRIRRRLPLFLGTLFRRAADGNNPPLKRDSFRHYNPDGTIHVHSSGDRFFFYAREREPILKPDGEQFRTAGAKHHHVFLAGCDHRRRLLDFFRRIRRYITIHVGS